jgi:hypothetical protein
MDPTDFALARKARWAYELGRLWTASGVLLLVAPLLAVAKAGGRPPVLVFGLGAPIVLISLALASFHDCSARAVRVGIFAALPAFILNLVARELGLLPMAGTLLDPCLPASFVSGVLAGVLVSLRAIEESQPLSFWVAAVVVTALLGTLGCSVAGSGGVLGLMVGVLSGAAAVVLRASLPRG